MSSSYKLGCGYPQFQIQVRQQWLILRQKSVQNLLDRVLLIPQWKTWNLFFYGAIRIGEILEFACFDIFKTLTNLINQNRKVKQFLAEANGRLLRFLLIGVEVPTT